MKRHLINDIFGDDSLCDYTQFMKPKTINKNKVKIYIYSWIYDGLKFL